MNNRWIRISIFVVLCFAVANIVGIRDLSTGPINHDESSMSIEQIYHSNGSEIIQHKNPEVRWGTEASRPVLLIGVFITGTTPIGVRDAFRNSTASTLPHIKLVFFVGREGDFKEEQAIHGDIVQGTFAENINQGKTYEWMLWASTQDADYVIKMDTDVSVAWRPFMEWVQSMNVSTYFGRINDRLCGGWEYCPPTHCRDFSGGCWIYMSGGLYGFSMDVVKSITQCEFANAHPSGQYEDIQSAHWVKQCVSGRIHVYHMDNGLLWCHQTNLDMGHISLGVIPSGCGGK
jgi:Galactosyltransferase